MSVQAIIYSKATGRVRRVVDPQTNVPNVIAFLAEAGAGAGEAVLVYNKQGAGVDNLVAWQAAVSAHTGLTPGTDWYCGVDQGNLIRQWGWFDPACGDGWPGLSILSAPAGADSRWSFDGAIFIAPPAVVVVKAPPA